MNVLPKTFPQIILKSKWFHFCMSPNQQRRPLPSLLYYLYSMLSSNKIVCRVGKGVGWNRDSGTGINHHTPKMDVLPKTFPQIILKSKWFHLCASPNQQQTTFAFPAVLSLFYAVLQQNCLWSREGGGMEQGYSGTFPSLCQSIPNFGNR